MLNEFRSSMIAESQRLDYVRDAENERLAKSAAPSSRNRSVGQMRAAVAALASIGLIYILVLVF